MGNIRLYGSTSGYVEIAPPAVGGSQVLTLPTDSVQPGLVLIATNAFSAVSSVSINNCFTSTYQNYRVVVSGYVASANTINYLRLRASSTDNSSASYGWAGCLSTSAGLTNLWGNGQTAFQIAYQTSTDGHLVADIMNPQVASKTTIYMQSLKDVSSPENWNPSGGFNATTQFDGFTLYPSSGTITGSIRVYGYRNT